MCIRDSVYYGIFFVKEIREASFGKTPVKRHLTALEPSHPAITGNRLLAFLPTTRILASSGTHAATHAPRRLLLSRRRFELTEIHTWSPLFFHDFQQVGHLCHHATENWRIGPLHDPV